MINVDGAGQTIANSIIVPVTPQGAFQAWPSTGMHVLVDLMGVFRPAVSNGGTPSAPSTGQITAEIIGYSPGGSITQVSGAATNRWSVLCDGVFSSGATIARIVGI